MLFVANVIAFCVLRFTYGLSVVPKCCPEGQGLKTNLTCIQSNNTLLHPFRPWKNASTYTKWINCTEDTVVFLDSTEFTLNDDGTCNVIGDDTTDEQYNNYCLDVDLSENITGAYICGDEGNNEETVSVMYPIGMILSLPFLFLTLAAYLILPISNIKNYYIRYNVFSMIFGYTSLITAQLFPDVPLAFCIYLVMFAVFFCVVLNIILVLSQEPLLPKCCPSNHTIWHGKCHFSTISIDIHWMNQTSLNWPLNCNGQDIIILDSKEYTMENASLYIFNEDGTKTKHEYDFCFDYNQDYNSTFIFVCIPEENEKPASVYYSFGMLISIPFLILTLMTYAVLPSLRNLNGYCLIAHITSILVGYCLLLGVQMFTNYMSFLSCVLFGFAVQFFFLATFFWLNVMCIDIYCAFSGFKIRGSASERNRKKLLAYSIYAWGMPLIILAVTVGVDYWDFIPPTSHFKPNIGKDRCFFKGRLATWTYFYGPMAVILFSNLVLFAITAYRIWRQRRENAVFQNGGDSRRHDRNESERFNLYLKLFLVMGINWISELVSFMFGKEVPQYLWYITDITNTLQGVFIFLIFVWKKRVRKLLWEKLKKKEARKGGSTTTCVEDIN